MSLTIEPGVEALTDFEGILHQLTVDPEAIEWSKRRRMVQTLAQVLERSAPDTYMLALAKLFCKDPKWEVRYASVDLLRYLWAAEMESSLDRLCQDPCPQVKQRAARFVQQRKDRKRTDRDAHKRLRDCRTQMQRLSREVGEEMVAEFCKLVDYEKAVLIGKLTHDLSRLISSIDQNTATLQAQLDASIQNKQILRKVVCDNRDQTEHLTRLTDDLRTYAGHEVAGKYVESIRSMVDWAIGIAKDHLRQRFEEKDAPQVTVHISDTISAEVAIHPLRMALANVIQNAMEASRGGTGRKGKVKTSVSLRPPNVTIRQSLTSKKPPSGSGVSKISRLWFAIMGLVSSGIR